MIRAILFVIALVLGGSAQAQGVSVQSGDHATFTRLVLTFPRTVDWSLGRTPQGYQLSVTGRTMPFDLSRVYDLIQKTRLRSIWVDPVQGGLQMGIGCACHIIPFELGTRILVLDIRDGPPPPGSDFELSVADGTRAPPLPNPADRGQADAASGYDWLSQAIPSGSPAPALPASLPPVAPEMSGLASELDLNPFRSMLVQELGRGASAGIVEIEVPLSAGPPAAETFLPGAPPSGLPAAADPPQGRAGLGDLPGLAVSAPGQPPPSVTLTGANCPDPAQIDLGSWSTSDDAAKDLSLARAAVLTEFDVPDPSAVLQAVRTHLYFGFGAEARQLMSSFLPDADPLLVGLSYLVDGDPPPQNPFDGLQSCDSAAALWALLAPPENAPALVDATASSRSFLGLPSHLRALLGPETTRRLLQSGDTANAEVVRRSFERAALPDAPAAALLRAEQALHKGDPVAAEQALPVAQTGSVALTALITRVESRFLQRKPVETADLLALQAFAFEHGDGPLKPDLDRALSLASALAGDFAGAFSHAAARPDLQRDVWALLADLGPEADLLAHAVGVDPALRDSLPLPTRSKMAERLAAAGLPNAARPWAGAADIPVAVSAGVALADNDGRAALAALARDPAATPADLLASAHTAVGAFEQAEAVLRGSGDAAQADRMLRWSGGTPSTSPGGEDPWSALTGLIAPEATLAEAPPLQAGQGQIEQSMATRAAIGTLLSAVPAPDAAAPAAAP